MEKRLLIVSNRLPVKVTGQIGNFQILNSEGGLATGLESACKDKNFHWIGWPGSDIPIGSPRDELDSQFKLRNLSSIYLTQDEINNYYEGFCNETLWPLYHYFPSYTLYQDEQWTAFVEVNRRFAEAIITSFLKDDIIWIHDFHLSLVPAMVREKIPDATIGYFQHIPFPTFEIFRLLPWRKEILQGLLEADLIGFHTLDDVRHFIDAVSHLTNLEIFSNQLMIGDRQVIADAFPMGIDYEKYRSLALSDRVGRNVKKIRQMTGKQKLMISVDRLDYTKGILKRLKSFEYLLDHYPECKENISFLQLVVPSRDHVPQYKAFKDEIDKMVSSINARFSVIGWTPIYYFYRSFPIHLLSALYKTADIALVTPMRDGMNLVSKEFIASKTEKKGILILSEMAGASKELLHAIMVNPNDVKSMVEAIIMAINMPKNEQKLRMDQMQKVISKFNVHYWVDLFIRSLEEVKEKQQLMNTKQVTEPVMEMISRKYQNAEKRLIILDYDGTLVPFNGNFLQAFPDNPLKTLLGNLIGDPANRIAIISGRNYLHLEDWFKDLSADLIAEHGAWHKHPGGSWELTVQLSPDWKPAIRQIMETITEQTPGSAFEEKSFSLVWHFRNVMGDIGDLRGKELCNNLKLFSADHALQVICGNKVVEIKHIEVNKGRSVNHLLQEGKYDFILVIGDDTTDEDMFRAVPSSAITIKVGGRTSAASYFISSYQEVRMLLRILSVSTRK